MYLLPGFSGPKPPPQQKQPIVIKQPDPVIIPPPSPPAKAAKTVTLSVGDKLKDNKRKRSRGKKQFNTSNTSTGGSTGLNIG